MISYASIDGIGARMHKLDLFILHVAEDSDVAQALAERLIARGALVGYDEFAVTVNADLMSLLKRGIELSQCGIVILSPALLSKQWSSDEVDALFATKDDSQLLLPVWHRLTYWQVRKRLPFTANRLAATTSAGMDQLVDQLERTVRAKVENVASKFSALPPMSIGHIEAHSSVSIADVAHAVERIPDGRAVNRARLATFLDEVAKDATILAQIWADLHRLSQQDGTCLEALDEIRANIERASFNQIGAFGELAVFVDFLDSTLGDNADFVRALRDLLTFRGIAREVFDASWPGESLVIQAWAGDAPSRERVRTLMDAVTAIHEEAGRLRALAKVFRANI